MQKDKTEKIDEGEIVLRAYKKERWRVERVGLWRRREDLWGSFVR